MGILQIKERRMCMLDIDKQLIEAEKKEIENEKKKLDKLRKQRGILKKITSPTFYLSEIADSFQKSKLVHLSILVPVVSHVVLGAEKVATSMPGSTSALALAGIAVSNGILVGGIAGFSMATVQVAGNIGKKLEELEGYNPLKARVQERKLLFSLKDRNTKVEQLKKIFSNGDYTKSDIRKELPVRVVKSSNKLPSNALKEKVRD